MTTERLAGLEPGEITGTGRTITLHVTGAFGLLTEAEVADLVWETLAADHYWRESPHLHLIGISLPSEEE